MRIKKMCIRKYDLKCDRVPGSGRVRIAFLSDLHNKLSSWEETVIFQKLEECSPDIVLVGGDVIIGLPEEPIGPAAGFMKKLGEKYPVWYANGNHEQRIRIYPERFHQMAEEYEKLLEKTKVTRLVNEKAEFEVGGLPFTVYGLEPAARFYKKGRRQLGMREELEKTFGQPDPERYTILLSHHPGYREEYMEWGADLTLCGHYHGGVILLGKKRGLITPDFKLFSDKCCGLSQEGETRMIVNAGTGEHTVPFRIHNPREITLIQIDF